MIKKFWIWLHQFFQRKSPRENAAISIANQQQIWFEQCEPGFLVWAQMPLPSEELAKIDPAHRIRPYLILARIKQELTAKACSSSPYSGLREYQTTMLARDHPLGKQTYIDLKHNVTLRAELLQNKPIPVERHDLRRIQKHLVLISQLDHIYHPYLNVPLLWEKGDILEIDHDLWYLQEFIPGKLRLIRLCHQYRAYMEDAGWNLFFCGRRGYFADFAHQAVYQGKTRLELVHRAAAHEIAYADYCQTQGKDQYIKWVPGYIVKREDETYIVLSRLERGWFCLEWHRSRKKWRTRCVRDFNGMECVGKVRRLKLRTLIASLMNSGIVLMEELDPTLLDYLGGQELDWETLKREAGMAVLIKGINRAAV